jgi:sugar phosphate isomerase/epimerase
MSNTNKIEQASSRRQFLYQGSLASMGLLLMGKSAMAANSLAFLSGQPNSLINGVQIGAITYSFRTMPGTAEQILQYCVDANISAIELMGEAIEEFAGAPKNPIQWVPGKKFEFTDAVKAQLKEYQVQMANWRTTVSMDKFKEIRKMYNKAGVSIYAFKVNAINPNNTDGEIEYALKAAKTLGAKSITVELPNDAMHSKRLGDLGEKHGIYIGYHAHLQATDTAWDIALAQSPYNSMNLDCGHYIAAGGANTKETLLALIEAKHDRITSMHIKDRHNKVNGEKNMPWGQGDTPIKEVLTLLRKKKYKIPATIELEYDIPSGSDAVKETKICFDYAKQILES